MLSWQFCLISITTTLVSDVHSFGHKVTLSSNGPIVKGGTITFKADFYNNDGTRPTGPSTYLWEDNAIPNHRLEVNTENASTSYSVEYPAKLYPAGLYIMSVTAHNGWWPFETSNRLNFEITGLLNGNLSLVQSNKLIESEYISSKAETNMTIMLHEPDRQFVFKNNSHEVNIHWFIDCRYHGQTENFNYMMNFTKPNTTHVVETLVVVSELPAPTPVPTTESPTNVTGNVTNTTEKVNVVPDQVAKAINYTDSNVLPLANITNGNQSCIDPSNIMSDPNKTYGYFKRQIQVRAPIEISVEGTDWIQPWDLLSLNVSCNGTGPFTKCLQFIQGKYNVTGNETCDSTELLYECKFGIGRYFLEPNVYTILIILKNDLGTTIYPKTINIYQVDKKPQLSVIVVPVSCSLAAVVLIVFGIAYYIQNRARFNVEVANFDFGKNNPDMEYKTFIERLRDSIDNSVRPGGEGISEYKPLDGNSEMLQ